LIPIVIYTDGACSGNPGPAGIGIILQWKDHVRKISRYIGEATNNIAELTAIEQALKTLKRHDLPVIIHTDSIYAINVLAKGFKARKNTELVEKIRKMLEEFSDVKIIKVQGHCGNEFNEMADQFAREAITGIEKK
jgi:ribonuclease HI